MMMGRDIAVKVLDRVWKVASGKDVRVALMVQAGEGAEDNALISSRNKMPLADTVIAAKLPPDAP